MQNSSPVEHIRLTNLYKNLTKPQTDRHQMQKAQLVENKTSRGNITEIVGRPALLLNKCNK